MLSAWQASGDGVSLQALVTAIRADALRFIARALGRLGIRDPDAADDAFALVLGHLRRLPGTDGRERGVTSFKVSAHATCGDPGAAFIHWLCRERALDVARSRQRRSRTCQTFSDLDDTSMQRIDALPRGHGKPPAALPTDDAELRRAVALLEPRQRAVIELVLEAKTLAVIAHVLGVSEGTVSRIRSRAIADLRRLLDGGAASDP
jgi:RNA polymerase sigma factor (sigma-70 family)